jgi:hypothetical protein
MPNQLKPSSLKFQWQDNLVLKIEKVVGEMFSMKGDMLNVSYAKK